MGTSLSGKNLNTKSLNLLDQVAYQLCCRMGMPYVTPEHYETVARPYLVMGRFWYASLPYWLGVWAMWFESKTSRITDFAEHVIWRRIRLSSVVWRRRLR